MVYIIFGASGSGKSTLLNVIRNEFGIESTHIKGTTRKKRQYDESEIISYPEGLPKDKYDYIYSQYGYEYGIEKNQIINAIEKKKEHFVICNDVNVIEKLRMDFEGQIKVIFLSFDAPVESIKMIQKARNITDDEIDVRINKMKFLHSLFIEKNYLFDYVIVNRFGEHPEKHLRHELYRIIGVGDDSLPSLTVVKETINYLVECVKKYERSIIDTPASQKDFLFIIMAMMEEEKNLKDIHYAIHNAAEKAGYKAERVDDKFDFGQINKKILNYINMAEVVVADITYERPNCYYEIGYAHAKGKKVILTAKKGTKIHFDINNFSVISYESVSELDLKLTKAFKESKELK